MDLAATRRLLRNSQLQRLMGAWTAFYIAAFGHFVLIVVVSFASGGAPAVGAATVLIVLPGGLLGPFLTGLATSARAQIYLAIGIGSRCLTMAATAVVVLAGAPVAVVLVLVGIDSLVSTAVRPLHGALVIRLADTAAEAAAGNAVTSSLVSASALVGPALAGVALRAVGIGWAFVLPAVIFAVGAVLALSIRVPQAEAEPAPSATRPSQREVLSAGFKAIFVSRPAVATAVLFVLNVTLVGTWFVANASVANDRLQLGEGGVTTIMTIYGAGGLVGALATLSIVGRRGLSRILAATMVVLAVVLALLGEVQLPALGFVLAACLGAAVSSSQAILPTLVQRSVSRRSMVAAVATLQSLYLVGMGVGAVLAPVLIESVGVAVALGVVGGAGLLVIVLAWPQLRHADELSADDAAKLAVIAATPELAPLRPLALEQLARVSTRLTIPAGAEAIHQGDRGDRFYMIAGGLADVTVDGRRVATLGPGGYFGEISLLHNEPRSATVTAREDLDLVEIDRGEFLSAVSQHESTLGRVGGFARVRLATRPVEERLTACDRDAALAGRSIVDLLTTQPPLASIGASALRELADGARVVAASDGALITREGDYGDDYYVILDGAASVAEGEESVRALKPGDGFGELAILRDVPRTATVRAVGDTTLIAVDREAFQRAYAGGVS